MKCPVKDKCSRRNCEKFSQITTTNCTCVECLKSANDKSYCEYSGDLYCIKGDCLGVK